MTRRCVPDEQYANLDRRLDEVKRRTDEGTLSFDVVMDGLQHIIEGKEVAATSKPDLLEPLSIFTVLGAKEFIAKKKFVINTSENARVRISWLGDNFKTVMLPKTERDIPETPLQLSKLKQASLDALIITELGDKAEITLHALYETLAHKQVVRNYEWTVGYIRGVDGNVWAVYAYWNARDGGWYLHAYSVERPHRWAAGSEFVSR